MTVNAFDVLGLRREGDVLDVDVHVECTTGTYVRALARDLGAALGVGGHLTALRRTRVGGFALAEAHTLEALERGVHFAAARRGDVAVVPASRRGRGPGPCRHAWRPARARWRDRPDRRLRPRRHPLALMAPKADALTSLVVLAPA